MKVHYDLKNIQQEIRKPVLTIGTFDGVHIGHQKILKKLTEKADVIGGESALFTFYPHPRQVLFPDESNLQLIQTQEEKIDKLAAAGLDHLIIFPFTHEFSRLTATEFVRDFLVNKLNVSVVVIGYDHHFGRNREGTLNHLQEMAPIYQFAVQEIPAEDIEDVNVSSTKIRNAILEGDVATAKTYLGAAFQLRGDVIEGDKIGRSLGYPTANIDIDGKDKIMPAYGVYIVQLEVNGNAHFGMASYGVRPTLEDNKSPQFEVYIIDFDENIYKSFVIVKFLHKLRDELKFDDLDTLKEQIEIDESNTYQWIQSSDFSVA